MLRKAFLLGGVVVFAVPALWIAIEHYRGRARLAEVVRRIEAEGGTLEFQKLQPPGVPSGSNGLAALMAASQRLEVLGAMIPPAFQMVGPGRAVPGTRMGGWDGVQGTNSWASLAEAVERHAEALEALHEALSRPSRRAELDLSRGFSSMKIPHLAPIKRSVTALAASASEAAHRGDLETLVGDLEAMRTVEADLVGEPLLISQLVRTACASIACSRAWVGAFAQAWDEPALARIQRALPAADQVSGVIRGLEGERAGGLNELRHATSEQLADLITGDAIDRAFGGGLPPLQTPGSVDEAVEFAGTFAQRLGRGLLSQVLLPLWRLGWGDHAVAFNLECLSGLIDAAKAGQRDRALPKVRAFDLQALLDARSGIRGLETILARLTLPALERASEKAFRSQTERNLHETGLAVLRFQRRHGRVPDRLEQLVPEFMAEVPVDWMDGRPVRYRRDSEQEFTLWSLGEDLKDNGGDGSWPAGRSRVPSAQWWSAHDAVWPQPASEAAMQEWLKNEAKRLDQKTRSPATRFTLSPDLMKRYGLVPRDPGAGTNAPAAAKSP